MRTEFLDNLRLLVSKFQDELRSINTVDDKIYNVKLDIAVDSTMVEVSGYAQENGKFVMFNDNLATEHVSFIIPITRKE